MKRLATIVLGFLLCTSTIADNTLLVGNIGMSAIVDQIGGAAITIPIEVPAGVKGMQPNLSLVYNSHRGYGLAGWGWDLAGISSIQRTGKTFYHDNTIDGIRRDNTDNLLLDGERLLLKSGSNLCENSTYRTEHESFSLITMDDYQGFTVNNSDTLSVTYDATTGNIISKSDLGASSEFTYDDSSKPHALRGVSGITSDWGSTDMSIRYTDFGKAQLIQRGDDSYSIVYGSSKERFITREDVSDVITTRYYMPTYEIVTDSNGKENYIIYLRNGSIVVYDKTSDTYALYHGYYDAQGSLVALTDNSGNVIARYAYDPWGRRVNPKNWAQSATAPDVLGINRGYTMHEHLDEFELINMNGRVYDPAVAQFLSPDPYIQDAGNWLNYNRYAYCYNNPTRYVDPDGEYVHIIIGAVIGGMINVWANQDACDGIGQVMAAFGAGALAGGLTAATGGATSGLLATAGAGFASAAIGGATLSGTNNLIAQTGEGFSGQVNWNDVGINALSGGLAGVAGYAGSQYIGPCIGTAISNTTKVNSPMIASGIKGMAAGFMGGAAAGYVGNYILTEDSHMASQAAIHGGVYGGITGFAGGVGAGYRYAKEHNIDIWTGKSLIDMTPEYSNALELIDQNSFYVNHRNHGTVYQNKSHDLPNLQYLYKSYYREYVFPTPGIKGAGMQRFVIGRFGEVYYTPDHYKSFYRLR